MLCKQTSQPRFAAANLTSGSLEGLCFHYGEPGHMQHHFPKCPASGKFSDGNSNSGGGKRPHCDVACHFCEKQDHVCKECEARKTWLATHLQQHQRREVESLACAM